MTMGVNFAPLPAENSTTVKTTPVNATTAPVLIPGTDGRMGGTIYNKANKSLWIKQGSPAADPVLTAGDPAVEVPPGGNWDIPSVYDGPIGLIWATGANTATKCYVVENLP
jgi:hypothetical protein